MTKIRILMTTTVLGLIPALFGMFYVIPQWIIGALDEIGSIQFYLMWVFISMYLMMIPYIYSLYLTFRLLIQIEHKDYYSKKSQTFLSHIGVSGYIIGAILFFDLPFVYGYAEAMDAPGMILVFGFLMILALSIGVFANILLELNEEKL
jgi:hypothetical protein